MSGSLWTVKTVFPTGDQAIDGLLYEYAWADATLYYDFPLTVQDYPHASGIGPNFITLSEQQQIAARFALDQDDGNAANDGFSVEGFTNLNVEQGFGGSAHIPIANVYLFSDDIFDPLGPGPNGRTVLPGPGEREGNVYINSDYYEVFDPLGQLLVEKSFSLAEAGDSGWKVMLHEIGHALGLTHPHEDLSYGELPLDLQSYEYTVMSYQDPLLNVAPKYPQTFMMGDIAALQHIYGADFTTNKGDTVYRWTPNSGDTLVNGEVGIDAVSNTIFATIWDGDGVDTYDLSAYTHAVEIDLRPGKFSDFHGQKGAWGGGNAAGNIYNALQYNNDPRSLIENATGGLGFDILVGNAADNVLKGGSGNDHLYAGDGVDQLFGESGNDTLHYTGGIWIDTLDGGADTDTADFSEYGPFFGIEVNLGSAGINATANETGFFWEDIAELKNIENVVGTAYDDTLRGDQNDNELEGLDGGDHVYGEGGEDRLVGFDGDDFLYGGTEDDELIGNAGSDHLYGGDHNDELSGGPDNDFLYGEAGDDTLSYRSGYDVLDGGTGTDTADFSSLFGSLVYVDLTQEGIVAGIPDDIGNILFYSIGELYNVENVIGTNLGDNLTGNDNANTLDGGGGPDYLYGGPGENVLKGEAGDDHIFWQVGDGRHIIDGGPDTDELHVVSSAVFETFFIETVADYANRVPAPIPLASATDIVVSRAVGADASFVIAELDGVEDIDVTSGGGNDMYIVSGDFVGTDLDPSTITITGSGGNDVADLSRLVSAHGVTLRANGGNDQIIGGNANTKVILSSAFSAYAQTLNPDGTLTLSAGPNNSFTTDNHDIIIQDPNNQGGTVDFNITPVAQDDSFETDEDTMLSGNLLANNGNGADSDWDNDLLTVLTVGPFATTALGSVVINANGSFTYAPALNFFGLDSFNYTLGDGQATDTAIAMINVLPVNDPAIIDGDLTGVVMEDTVIGDTTLIATGNLTISDVDSPEIFLAGQYDGSYGTLFLTEDGAYEYYLYNANTDVQGLDSNETMTDEVIIKSFDETPATITITIEGIDEEKGNPNGQLVDGTPEDDDGTLDTGNGDDVVNGLTGDDDISTGNKDDFIQAGSGDDTVSGGNGDDTISGDAGDDIINGENGNDILHGGPGNDQIFGGNDDDLLDPGDGLDILTGGNGSDAFVLDLDGLLDEVTDFQDGVDQLQITDGLTFSDLTVQNHASGVSISVAGNEELLLKNIADAALITSDDFAVTS